MTLTADQLACVLALLNTHPRAANYPALIATVETAMLQAYANQTRPDTEEDNN